MQPINNDMDELFRKAADQYPLNTTGMDFNKVIKGMEDPKDPGIIKKKNFNYKKYPGLLLLLFLLPLTLFFSIRLYMGMNEPKSPLIQKRLTESPPANADHARKIDDKNENGRAFRSNNEAKKQPDLSVSDAEKSISKVGPENGLNKKFITAGSESVPAPLPFYERKFFSNQPIITQGSQFFNSGSSVKEMNAGAVQEIRSTLENDLKKGGVEAGKDASIYLSEKEKKANKEAKQPRFYTSIMIGADLSAIKFQQVHKTGFNLGVLAGYQLNNKLAVETGLWWAKKKYYTDGKYFNTKKVNIPYGVNIIDVDGSCGMFEIPINIRYRFFANKQKGWFASAGVTSYIMKKEDYKYKAERLGEQYDAYRSYSNSSKNLFSAIQIAGGYEHSLGKTGKLRIEPYLKIPLYGMGIGDLPITSTGINIGFTPSFK